MSKLYVFNVFYPKTPKTGDKTLKDIVTVTVDSGNAGGKPGQFEHFMKEAIAEWFSAYVTVETPDQTTM